MCVCMCVHKRVYDVTIHISKSEASSLELVLSYCLWDLSNSGHQVCVYNSLFLWGHLSGPSLQESCFLPMEISSCSCWDVIANVNIYLHLLVLRYPPQPLSALTCEVAGFVLQDSPFPLGEVSDYPWLLRTKAMVHSHSVPRVDSLPIPQHPMQAELTIDSGISWICYVFDFEVFFNCCLFFFF